MDEHTNAISVAELRARVAEGMPTTVADLESLVRIPSCAFPGFPLAEVLRGAERTAEIFRDAGYGTVELLPLPEGPPAVYAEAAGPADSPTVLLYAHYDIQPPGDLDAWDSPPFEPEVRDGRLYGRGAADDKSGVAIHAAVMRAFAGRPPCTVRVIVEGEEECGGAFEAYPRANPTLFDADAIVVADVGNLALGEPTLTTALRGMVMATVHVRTLAGPVHSGMFGGPAPDALMALITLLATLRDEAGDAAVAGVDGSGWSGPEYDEGTFREVAGVLPHQPLVGSGSVAARLFGMPAVSVVGIDAPPIAGAINAVVPAASARVSLRIPPGVDPVAAEAALVDHLESHAPWGIDVTVDSTQASAGFEAATDGPAYRAMREAMAESYGKAAVMAGAGGSIPLVDVLSEVVPRAELLLVGAQDPLARIHAPNESVDLAELQSAVLAETLFIAGLAGER